MTVVSLAAELVAQWASLYNESSVISTSVTFVHLGGLLLGGGCAVAADRMTLRLSPANSARFRAHLQELHGVHRPVLIGLALTLVSGMLMLAADLETFLPSTLFWFKMGLIAVLLGNGLRLRRAEMALRFGWADQDRGWLRLQRAARASLTLWFGSLLLGTALLAA